MTKKKSQYAVACFVQILWNILPYQKLPEGVRINAAYHWGYIQWQDAFSTVLIRSEYFIFGSLLSENKRSKSTAFKCLETAKIKVLDINLGPPFCNKKP